MSDIEGPHEILRKPVVIAAGVVAVGMIVGGYLLGDGLKRAKDADRSVTVRGLAEKNVTADLAVWTIAYSAQAPTLAAAQADIDGDTAAIRAFFRGAGFTDSDLKPSGVSVNQFNNNGVDTVTIRQRLQLRTGDIKKAQAAVARQFDLVRSGVQLDEGSGIAFSFTKLNDIKPKMVADATMDARKSAEQFASDSGTGVGGIKSASQGYFSIEARDGEQPGYGVADSPYKKVRVVTTIDFYLD
jgi:hypothetical protein